MPSPDIDSFFLPGLITFENVQEKKELGTFVKT